MSVIHLMNRVVAVWRTERTPDGAGGWITAKVFSHELDVRISRANIAERTFSRTAIGDMQAGAELTHIVYADGLADIRRGDELRDGEFSELYRVIGTQRASVPDVYTRAQCELIEVEPFLAPESES